MTTSDFDAVRHRKELRSSLRGVNQAIPEQMKGFATLHMSAIGEGALPRKHKELMAMAIAITQQCTDCIVLHAHDALDHGATPEEFQEAIGVALLMGGGPASMYATVAVHALEQFQTAGVGLVSGTS
jgi:AhpD family alkylhydroperoxidase